MRCTDRRVWFCLCALVLQSAAWAADATTRPVRIEAMRQGRFVVLRAVLDHCTDATVSLDVTLENMTSSEKSPLTMDIRSGWPTELVRLFPAGAGGIAYRYTYSCQIGGRSESTIDNTPFALPYAPDRYFRVVQGPGGPFSHQPGSNNENAIDWAMPEGTEVLAARAGIVTGYRSDSSIGGTDPSLQNQANYVVIRHSDNTYAEYLHLQKDGVRVRLGQRVKQGEVIGLSGNTGYSRGPHLHLVVFRNLDGKTRTSLKLQFLLKDGTIAELQSGNRY